MKVVWTHTALQRLAEIEEFISHDTPSRAVRFVEKLIARGEALRRFPNAGRNVPELDSPDVREILEGNYRLVYRIIPQRVEILTVFEGHRQIPIGDISSHEAR